MKYIIINDFKNMFIKNRKYVYSYYIIIYLMLFVSFLFNYKYNNLLFYRLIGLDFNLSKGEVLSVLMFLFNSTFIVYVSICLLLNDIQFGAENIFLRIKLTTWIIYKKLSILCNLILLRIILYVPLMLFFYNKIDILKIFGLDILYIFTLQILSIFIYIIYVRNKIVAGTFGIILLILLLKINISINILEKNYYIILLLIIGLIVSVTKLINNKIFEYK